MSDIVKKNSGDVVVKKGFDITAMRKKTGLTKTSQEFKNKKMLQLLVMFDITGSTFEYFDYIREKLNEIATFVGKEVDVLEMAICAFRNHGDEKLHKKIYYQSVLNDNIEEIRNFIAKIESGGGGNDGLTCMEDCLKEANLLQWKSGSPKAIVIIGDMPPHGVIDSVSKCPKDINYKFEVEELIRKKIPIYPVFCGHQERVREFYRWMAKISDGRFLEIKEVDLLTEILIGICMKQTGNFEQHVERLKKFKQLTPRVEKILALLE